MNKKKAYLFQEICVFLTLVSLHRYIKTFQTEMDIKIFLYLFYIIIEITNIDSKRYQTTNNEVYRKCRNNEVLLTIPFQLYIQVFAAGRTTTTTKFPNIVCMGVKKSEKKDLSLKKHTKGCDIAEDLNNLYDNTKYINFVYHLNRLLERMEIDFKKDVVRFSTQIFYYKERFHCKKLDRKLIKNSDDINVWILTRGPWATSLT